MLPLSLGACAIFITLIFASYLDIKDRRVPITTWRPMVLIGMPLTAATFYLLSRNVSLVIGYAALWGILLYSLYLDNTDTKETFNYLYLAMALILPGIAWFLADQNIILGILFMFILAILLYASYLDIQQKMLPLREYVLVIVLPIFSFGSFFLYTNGKWGILGLYIALIGIFCSLFYLFGALHLFGGADAWALIFVAALIPIFPIKPFFDYPSLQFLPFTVLINALILNLVTPLGIFFMNVGKKNFAPFPYMFFGFPVPGDRVEQYYGFVMEEISEYQGDLTRRFVSIRKSLSTMVRGGDRLYTKDIRLHPEQYTKERALFMKAGHIWISYGVPFILPITAGFFTALLAGDILYTVMRIAIGV